MSKEGDKKLRDRIKKLNNLYELSRRNRKTEYREQAARQLKIARNEKLLSGSSSMIN